MLWMGLTHLTFRGLEPSRIQALLRRFAASPRAVFTLDIDISSRHTTYNCNANSLLRAAVQLLPGQLIFRGKSGDIDLPCFHCTSSIEINSRHSDVTSLPAAGVFTALETLSVTGNSIDFGSLLNRLDKQFPKLEKLSICGTKVNLDSLLNRCQHLRVLCVSQSYPCHLRVPGGFPVLENLSLSGNIPDIGTLLNQCPRLRVLGVTFLGMGLRSIKAALTVLEKAAQLGLMVSILGIQIPWREDITQRRFTHLLRVVARISPQELVVTDNLKGYVSSYGKTIKINLPAVEFSRLERLSLSEICSIIDIGTLITRCPRLRVLKVTVAKGNITVHSASLQKLHLNRYNDADFHSIDIVTPVLQELRMVVRAAGDISVSISAPIVENAMWQRSYTGSALLFGSWYLKSLKVHTIERSYTTKREGMTSPLHVLCLHLTADNQSDAEPLTFVEEVEELPVTNFSVLEINFDPAWHIYGPIMLRLLRMHRICAATKKLKVVLPMWPKVKQACLEKCPCNKPENWRSQSIFSTRLEDIQICGFNGEDHEYDFLRIILTCSPMLERVNVEPSHVSEGCTMELSNISLAHPSVKFYCSGRPILHASGCQLPCSLMQQ